MKVWCENCEGSGGVEADDGWLMDCEDCDGSGEIEEDLEDERDE